MSLDACTSYAEFVLCIIVHILHFKIFYRNYMYTQSPIYYHGQLLLTMHLSTYIYVQYIFLIANQHTRSLSQLYMLNDS